MSDENDNKLPPPIPPIPPSDVPPPDPFEDIIIKEAQRQANAAAKEFQQALEDYRKQEEIATANPSDINLARLRDAARRLDKATAKAWDAARRLLGARQGAGQGAGRGRIGSPPRVPIDDIVDGILNGINRSVPIDPSNPTRRNSNPTTDGKNTNQTTKDLDRVQGEIEEIIEKLDKQNKKTDEINKKVKDLAKKVKNNNERRGVTVNPSPVAPCPRDPSQSEIDKLPKTVPPGVDKPVPDPEGEKTDPGMGGGVKIELPPLPQDVRDEIDLEDAEKELQSELEVRRKLTDDLIDKIIERSNIRERGLQGENRGADQIFRKPPPIPPIREIDDLIDEAEQEFDAADKEYENNPSQENFDKLRKASQKLSNLLRQRMQEDKNLMRSTPAPNLPPLGGGGSKPLPPVTPRDIEPSELPRVKRAEQKWRDAVARRVASGRVEPGDEEKRLHKEWLKELEEAWRDKEEKIKDWDKKHPPITEAEIDQALRRQIIQTQKTIREAKQRLEDAIAGGDKRRQPWYEDDIERETNRLEELQVTLEQRTKAKKEKAGTWTKEDDLTLDLNKVARELERAERKNDTKKKIELLEEELKILRELQNLYTPKLCDKPEPKKFYDPSVIDFKKGPPNLKNIKPGPRKWPPVNSGTPPTINPIPNDPSGGIGKGKEPPKPPQPPKAPGGFADDDYEQQLLKLRGQLKQANEDYSNKLKELKTNPTKENSIDALALKNLIDDLIGQIEQLMENYENQKNPFPLSDLTDDELSERTETYEDLLAKAEQALEKAQEDYDLGVTPETSSALKKAHGEFYDASKKLRECYDEEDRRNKERGIDPDDKNYSKPTPPGGFGPEPKPDIDPNAPTPPVNKLPKPRVPVPDPLGGITIIGGDPGIFQPTRPQHQRRDGYPSPVGEYGEPLTKEQIEQQLRDWEDQLKKIIDSANARMMNMTPMDDETVDLGQLPDSILPPTTVIPKNELPDFDPEINEEFIKEFPGGKLKLPKLPSPPAITIPVDPHGNVVPPPIVPAPIPTPPPVVLPPPGSTGSPIADAIIKDAVDKANGHISAARKAINEKWKEALELLDKTGERVPGDKIKAKGVIDDIFKKRLEKLNFAADAIKLKFDKIIDIGKKFVNHKGVMSFLIATTSKLRDYALRVAISDADPNCPAPTPPRLRLPPVSGAPSPGSGPPPSEVKAPKVAPEIPATKFLKWSIPLVNLGVIAWQDWNKVFPDGGGVDLAAMAKAGAKFLALFNPATFIGSLVVDLGGGALSSLTFLELVYYSFRQNGYGGGGNSSGYTSYLNTGRPDDYRYWVETNSEAINSTRALFDGKEDSRKNVFFNLIKILCSMQGTKGFTDEKSRKVEGIAPSTIGVFNRVDTLGVPLKFNVNGVFDFATLKSSKDSLQPIYVAMLTLYLMDMCGETQDKDLKKFKNDPSSEFNVFKSKTTEIGSSLKSVADCLNSIIEDLYRLIAVVESTDKCSYSDVRKLKDAYDNAERKVDYYKSLDLARKLKDLVNTAYPLIAQRYYSNGFFTVGQGSILERPEIKEPLNLLQAQVNSIVKDCNEFRSYVNDLVNGNPCYSMAVDKSYDNRVGWLDDQTPKSKEKWLWANALFGDFPERKCQNGIPNIARAIAKHCYGIDNLESAGILFMGFMYAQYKSLIQACNIPPDCKEPEEQYTGGRLVTNYPVDLFALRRQMFKEPNIFKCIKILEDIVSEYTDRINCANLWLWQNCNKKFIQRGGPMLLPKDEAKGCEKCTGENAKQALLKSTMQYYEGMKAVIDRAKTVRANPKAIAYMENLKEEARRFINWLIETDFPCDPPSNNISQIFNDGLWPSPSFPSRNDCVVKKVKLPSLPPVIHRLTVPGFTLPNCPCCQ